MKTNEFPPVHIANWAIIKATMDLLYIVGFCVTLSIFFMNCPHCKVHICQCPKP